MDPLLLDGGLFAAGLIAGGALVWLRYASVASRPATHESARALHELHLNSVEETAGRRIGVYTCSRCQPPHIERRELAS